MNLEEAIRGAPCIRKPMDGAWCSGDGETKHPECLIAALRALAPVCGTCGNRQVYVTQGMHTYDPSGERVPNASAAWAPPPQHVEDRMLHASPPPAPCPTCLGTGKARSLLDLDSLEVVVAEQVGVRVTSAIQHVTAIVGPSGVKHLPTKRLDDLSPDQALDLAAMLIVHALGAAHPACPLCEEGMCSVHQPPCSRCKGTRLVPCLGCIVEDCDAIDLCPACNKGHR